MQALKLATDREAILQSVTQGLGTAGRDSPIGPLYTAYYTEDTPLVLTPIVVSGKIM